MVDMTKSFFGLPHVDYDYVTLFQSVNNFSNTNISAGEG